MSDLEQLQAYHADDSPAPQPDDDWTLTTAQMMFMMNHHNFIMAAYAEGGDLKSLNEIIDTDEYRTAFGNMSWDEAFDRYEDMPHSPASPLAEAYQRIRALEARIAALERRLDEADGGK